MDKKIINGHSANDGISADTITVFEESVIQHGKHNDRVYLMKLSKYNIPELLKRLDTLCGESGYSKIIAKVPIRQSEHFFENGYQIEAMVPGFYNGTSYLLFMAKYFSETRRNFSNDTFKELETLIHKSDTPVSVTLDNRFTFRRAVENDLEKMAALYRQVFISYPFPIHDQEYLRRTMRENVVYYGIWDRKELAALSSVEIDFENTSVEMTDFAVLPEYRGNRFAQFLLRQMEMKMKRKGIKTGYTIARSNSVGMNLTFFKSGYRYGGTLINNTNIAGGLESMNVWYRKL